MVGTAIDRRNNDENRAHNHRHDVCDTDSWTHILLEPDTDRSRPPSKEVLTRVRNKLQQQVDGNVPPVEVCMIIVEQMVLHSLRDDGDDSPSCSVLLSLEILELLFVVTAAAKKRKIQQQLQTLIDPLLQIWNSYPIFVTRLLTQALHIKACSFSQQQQRQVCEGIVQQILRLHQNYEHETMVELLLAIIKEVTKVVPPIQRGEKCCALWDDATVYTFVLSHASTYPDECARILWNGAIAAPEVLAQQDLSIWTYIRKASESSSSSSSIVAAIVGNLVSGAPDYLLQPEYPWLIPFLCERLDAIARSANDDDATLRRIVRTLRCMGPEIVVQYAPTTCLQALVETLTTEQRPTTTTAPTRILICQTLTGILPLSPLEQRTQWCPALQLYLIDRMIANDTEDAVGSSSSSHLQNMSLVVCECLLATIQSSPWSTSISCFPEAFFQQLLLLDSTTIIPNRAPNQTTVVQQLVYHVLLQRQSRMVDEYCCHSPALLELLSRWMRHATSSNATAAIDIVSRIAATPQNQPCLAADPYILTSLIDVCNNNINKHQQQQQQNAKTTTNGMHETKGVAKKAKDLVVQLMRKL